ncbi:PilZ domain-containing protein [Clostridium aciditolerans]|uniref:PilZ domain-containing protein n=1 Tax=Clostridium aciditolerans TaxID=339861 RepID=A0A934HV99_9CLOT|nr:PilZ domain-containing protein [Clostridium aciditolerans]MBI6871463.1 PilZ domain-containing protein [Clostridium aciditolerans]
MIPKNIVHKNGDYIYKSSEKRFANRSEFYADIYYPTVNNKSVYEQYKFEGPIMRTINLSKTGILIESKIALQVGDFINFTLKIGDNPSFWYLAEVKRITIKESFYYIGCEFISLDMNQINIIERYVDSH